MSTEEVGLHRLMEDIKYRPKAERLCELLLQNYIL